jgi:hypothetical protein
MSREKSKQRRDQVDAELKAIFDAKAQESVPDRLLDLVEDLDVPPKATKTA